jgi:hypothetical protein
MFKVAITSAGKQNNNVPCFISSSGTCSPIRVSVLVEYVLGLMSLISAKIK